MENKEPKSKIQNLLMLTSLQTAIGYFKEDEFVEKLIGQKLDEYSMHKKKFFLLKN